MNPHAEHETPGFVFRGELLALDFVNTTLMKRGKRADLLTSPADLAAWWEAAQQHHPDAGRAADAPPPRFDDTLFSAAKTLRDALRRLFLSLIEGEPHDPDDLAILNGVLRLASPIIEWQPSTSSRSLYWSDQPTAGVLLPIALSALHLLAHSDLERLHKCHNDRCILLFYDTTKSATRQWCSTACFERERSSRRYAEKKHSAEDEHRD